MDLAIVIPVRDEAERLPHQLACLAPLRARGVQVIVVDGGSRDASGRIAAEHGVTVCHTTAGRARQMNAGASLAARADTLLFLHADTLLPPDADRLVAAALEGGRRAWGRFDVIIDGRSPMLCVIAWAMNLRSRVTGIATGDQAIFVTRRAFDAVRGFPDQPLMEDVEISQRLKRISPPACLEARVHTSGRRWEARGVWRTIVLMWRLRWAYWRGATPEDLARRYR